MKCGVIDGSVVNGLRQPILYSLLLDKPVGYKVFSQPETVHYKKINKSILNSITFYLEDVINGKIDFNGETLTFKLQMIKFFIILEFFKFETNSYCVGGGHRSATVKNYGDITSKVSKVLIGYCSIGKR